MTRKVTVFLLNMILCIAVLSAFSPAAFSQSSDEILFHFDGDPTGWEYTSEYISFSDNRMYWKDLPRNANAYAYKEVQDLPSDLVIEYTFMKTADSSRGCTVVGVLSHDTGENMHDFDYAVSANEVYCDGQTHSISALKAENGERPIPEGNPVQILMNTQYWVRSVLIHDWTHPNIGMIHTTLYSDADRTIAVGTSILDVVDLNLYHANYVYLITTWGDDYNTDTQSGWLTDFTIRKPKKSDWENIDHSGDPDLIGVPPISCDGVTCPDYCDGTNLHHSGHCVDGECVYDIKINATECGYVPPDETLVHFDGDPTGWTHTSEYISFSDNRMYWKDLPRNANAYAYKEVQDLPSGLIIEYTFMKTDDSSRGCTVVGVLSNDTGENMHDFDNAVSVNEVYCDGQTHSISTLKVENGERPIPEGNLVEIQLNKQYWVRSIIENGVMTTHVFEDQANTVGIGSSTINVHNVDVNYVYLITTWGNDQHTDPQSGWLSDFTIKAYPSDPPVEPPPVEPPPVEPPPVEPPPVDDDPPVITDVSSADIASSSAAITWTTDEASDSQVEYGPTTSYGFQTSVDTALAKNHIQTLTGLDYSTTYHYRVKSEDASNNLAVSQDNSFTTISDESAVNSITVSPSDITITRSETVLLDTPTYDGSGQAVHPDIYYNENGWKGYKYWMVMTPYPGGNDDYENPSILVSDDGISWIVPAGLTNPIDPMPEAGSNSDTEIVYNDKLDRLEVYYVESGAGTSYLKRKTSTDGISWSGEQDIFSLPDYQVMSPAIIKNGDMYDMWYTGGASCSADMTLKHSVSTDGVSWSEPQTVNIESDLNIWHVDVSYIPSLNEYWMLYAAYPVGSNCGNTDLYFAKSADKLNWVNYGDIIIERGATWDYSQIYRATFRYDSNSNTLGIWYSARGDDAWRIGYAERQYFSAEAEDQFGNPMTVPITWISSNTDAGTIDSSGMFTALAEGISTITASSGSVSGTATATVTATGPPDQTKQILPSEYTYSAITEADVLAWWTRIQYLLENAVGQNSDGSWGGGYVDMDPESSCKGSLPLIRETAHAVMGYSYAYRVIDDPFYQEQAIEGLEWLLSEQLGGADEGAFNWYCTNAGGAHSYPTGLAGRALIEGYKTFGDQRYLDASALAAQWEANQPYDSNANYNAFMISHLAEHYRVTGDTAALDAAVGKSVQMLTYQTSGGYWSDSLTR